MCVTQPDDARRIRNYVLSWLMVVVLDPCLLAGGGFVLWKSLHFL